MRKQGDGRSGTDTKIYGSGWWLADSVIAGLGGESATLVTDQMKMLSGPR